MRTFWATRVLTAQPAGGEVATLETHPTTSARYLGPAGLLLVAVWFGLLIGLTEVALRGVQKFLLHQIIFVSMHVVWMAPLADVLCCAVPGCLLALLVRYWPRLISLRSAACLYTFLSCLGPLWYYPRLHRYAALLLAAGISIQAARLIAAHAGGFLTLVRHTIGWLAALVVGLAVGGHGWEVLTERQTLARLPIAPHNAPNVLFIVLDTVRAASLSLYGYTRPTTPHLEKLATRSIVFERVWSTAPWTLPSHASMFTGHYPYEMSANWLTPLDATYPTLAEVLRTQGYVTSGFVANRLYGTYESGLNRGFIHYEDYPISPEVVAHSSWLARMSITQLRESLRYHRPLGWKTAVDINRDFLAWLSSQGQRPFFAFLNYMDAHEPYLPPPPFDTQFGPKKPWATLSRRQQWSAQELQAEIASYDGAIAHLDHHLGLLFEELHKRGVLDNTLLIVTSDHGELLGEHGLLGHGNSLYRPLLEVPLLISFPSHLPIGRRVRELVSLRNLPATLMDILQLPGGASFPGTSLVSYWKEGSQPSATVAPLLSEVSEVKNCLDTREAGPVCKGDMHALVAEGLHYIHNGDGREELYDVESDPAEEHDLAGAETSQQVLQRFRTSLTTLLRSNRSARAVQTD